MRTLGLGNLGLKGMGLGSEGTSMQDKDLVVVKVDRKKENCAMTDTKG